MHMNRKCSFNDLLHLVVTMESFRVCVCVCAATATGSLLFECIEFGSVHKAMDRPELQFAIVNANTVTCETLSSLPLGCHTQRKNKWQSMPLFQIDWSVCKMGIVFQYPYSKQWPNEIFWWNKSSCDCVYAFSHKWIKML